LFRFVPDFRTIWILILIIRIFINLFSQFTLSDLWENFVVGTRVFFVTSRLFFKVRDLLSRSQFSIWWLIYWITLLPYFLIFLIFFRNVQLSNRSISSRLLSNMNRTSTKSIGNHRFFINVSYISWILKLISSFLEIQFNFKLTLSIFNDLFRHG